MQIADVESHMIYHALHPSPVGGIGMGATRLYGCGGKRRGVVRDGGVAVVSGRHGAVRSQK